MSGVEVGRASLTVLFRFDEARDIFSGLRSGTLQACRLNVNYLLSP